MTFQLFKELMISVDIKESFLRLFTPLMLGDNKRSCAFSGLKENVKKFRKLKLTQVFDIILQYTAKLLLKVIFYVFS